MGKKKKKKQQTRLGLGMEVCSSVSVLLFDLKN